MVSKFVATSIHPFTAAPITNSPGCSRIEVVGKAQKRAMAMCRLAALLFPAVALASFPADTIEPCFDASCIAPAQPSQLKNRPQLLPYVALADTGAVVAASDGMARFTVLTDHLIRMEYARTKGQFEDRASLAVLNRKLPVPKFTHAVAGGVLTITTDAVELEYEVGKGFTPETLSVKPVGAEATDKLGFPGWKWGDANPGNLLGTIRGQDGQSATPLNCTTNMGVGDNGEYNHCEWGLVSRDGWVVYDDSNNAYTDENDWWSTAGHTAPAPPPAPGPSNRNCSTVMKDTDAKDPSGDGKGLTATQAQCCDHCVRDPKCSAYVWATDGGQVRTGPHNMDCPPTLWP